MHWAEEAPTFRKQLSHGCCLHFSEVLPSVNASEMREVSVIVKLISNDCVTSCLHQVQVCPGDEVTCRQEMLHLLSNAHLGIDHLFEIVRVPDLERVELRVLKVSG